MELYVPERHDPHIDIFKNDKKEILNACEALFWTILHQTR